MPAAIMTEDRLSKLRELGQSVWIDFISRDALRSGELERYIAAGVLGLTSNPSIFEKAMTAGAAYDEDIERLVSEGKTVAAIYEALAIADITAAADLLGAIHEQTQGTDGYVSLEVAPRLSHDGPGTVAEAQRLWAAIGRPNLMIKVPGTAAGASAVRQLIAAGINVNVTLLFALDAYEAAAYAYIEGLEARVRAGLDVQGIASVASFFVSRIDTRVDRRLAGLPDWAELRGRAAVACARLVYASFQRVFSGPRWDALAALGARVQRPLWASTSTKDPDYSDTLYVDSLIGPQTVNTMPPETLEATVDHAVPAETITRDREGTKALLERLADLGIDMRSVTDALLQEGIASFVGAHERLETSLAAKTAALRV